MNDWNNTSVAESAWEMISLVRDAQGGLSLLTEGEPEGVLLSAMEDLVGFATRNPDVMPAWLHDRYVAFLRGKGFKWEATTDVAQKTSRAIVAWSDLSQTEATEYAIFMGVLSIITKGPSKKAAKKAPGQKRTRRVLPEAPAANGTPAAAGDAPKEDDLVI